MDASVKQEAPQGNALMRFLAALAASSVRNRIAVFAACAIILVAGAAGALKLTFNPDARIYFSRDAAERIAFDEIVERYGSRRDVIAIVQPTGGADASGLRVAAESVADALKGVAGVADVGAAPAGQKGGIEIHEGEPPVAAFPISITALGADAYEAVSAIQRAGDEVLSGQAFELLLTGEPAQEAAAMNAIRNDLGLFVPIEVVLIIGILLLALGSLTATISLLCVLGVATAATMGGYGWTGAALNGVTSAVPSSLLGLSVATSVHLILGWQHGLRDGEARQDALMHSVRINAVPIVLATVTTVISFACLNLADSPAFHAFGTLVAIGLVLTLLLSFTLLPALISVIPANPVNARAGLERAMARLGALVCDHKIVLLLAGVVVAGVSLYGTSQVVFRDTFSAYFDESYPFRRATLIYEEHVGGITPVEFSVPLADGETFASPSYAADIAAFRHWAVMQPKVSRVIAVTDVLKAGGEAYGLTDAQGVPVDAGSAAMLGEEIGKRGEDAGLQYLLGRKFADEPAGEGATRVIVILQSAASDDILSFAEDAEDELERLGAARATTATGMPVLAAHLSQRNGASMIKATPLALAAISLLMVLALGSWRLGLASLVPNLMPLLMAYGVWGLVMGDLTFAGTMVIAMTFGIVVDDTVHMMSRYRHLRKAGFAPRAAMVETFRTVGIAVFTTTVAIASGFSVLSLSGFVVNRDLGAVTTMTLLSALAATLLFLPPLLLLLDRAAKTSADK